MSKDIDALLALAEKATPGPWIQGMVNGRCRIKHEHGRGSCSYDYTISTDDEYERHFVSIAPNVTLIGSDDNGPILSKSNAAFIAAASPDVVIALCKRVRDLESALAEALEAWASGYEDQRTSSQAMEHPRIVELRKLLVK